jgi:hypothetical protein
MTGNTSCKSANQKPILIGSAAWMICLEIRVGSVKRAGLDFGWMIQVEEKNSKRRVNFMVKLLRACVWMPWRK